MATKKSTDDSLTEQQQSQLEHSMKDLLEKILSYMEKFIKTKEDLQAIEEKLNDYDNLNSLLDIIKNIFQHLTTKIDQQISKNDKSKSNQGSDGSNSTSSVNEDYDQLEKMLQKQEAEIRMHIRSNQTMKLYQENLQQKLDESEQARSELLESTKQMINDQKRQNNSLGEQVSKMESEIRQLNEKINSMTANEKVLEEKLFNLPYLEEKIQTLEKMVKDTMQDRYLSSSMSNMLSKESSIKKMDDNRKAKKTESSERTGGMNSMVMMMSQGNSGSTSPLKIERRAPTPNLLVSNKENAMKSTYQRFYNNFKLREENKNTRPVTEHSSSHAFSNSKTGINQLISSTVREKETRTLHSQGNSMTTSHNNSFIYTTSNNNNINNNSSSANNTVYNSSSSKIFKQQLPPTQAHQLQQHLQNNNSNVLGANSALPNAAHKRAKSHTVNKIRGVVNGGANTNTNNNNNSSNNTNHAPSQKTITDYSRLSNHDLSDLQQTFSAYNNKP